jgi:hypothetical protein
MTLLKGAKEADINGAGIVRFERHDSMILSAELSRVRAVLVRCCRVETRLFCWQRRVDTQR